MLALNQKENDKVQIGGYSHCGVLKVITEYHCLHRILMSLYIHGRQRSRALLQRYPSIQIAPPKTGIPQVMETRNYIRRVDTINITEPR